MKQTYTVTGMTCSACSRMVSPTTVPVVGSRGICPEVKTIFP